MDIEKSAEELRKKIGEFKKTETEQETKERMKSVLSGRDEAMKVIYEYQKKTGVPTREETERHFFDVEINQKD